MVRDGGATVIFQWTYSQCETARRRVESELRPSRDRSPLCDRRLGCRWKEAAGDAADQ